MKTRNYIILLIIFVFTSWSFGQEKKFQITLFSGINHVFEYGTERDYSPGDNSFPVTPAHDPLCAGFFFSYSLSARVALEFDAKYIWSSSVLLKDPSDGDTVF